MSHLLDVNFLVALFDSRHINHEAAHRWFGRQRDRGWATCSITELGLVRVLSNPAYPTVSATPVEVSGRLAQFCESRDHRFLPDDRPPRSSIDDDVRQRLRSHGQVTDFHLAALASRHSGSLVTFDGRLRRALADSSLAPSIVLVE